MKLITLLSFLTILTSLTSCGKFDDHLVAKSPNPKMKGIDSAFSSYVNDFSNDYHAQFGRNPRLVPVNFYDLKSLGLPSNTVGVCYSYGNKGIEIFINKTWWDNNHKIQDRKRLIYHELGHCVLNRGHDNGSILSIWGSIKKSFMHSYITGYNYESHSHIESSYIHELLTKKVDESILENP